MLGKSTAPLPTAAEPTAVTSEAAEAPSVVVAADVTLT